MVDQNLEQASGRVGPEYTKIRNWVLDYIRQNELEAGDRLPSDRSISNLLGVNRGLVARAVSELASEGLLNRQKGNGTFLAEQVQAPIFSKTGSVGLLLPLVEPSNAGEPVGGLGIRSSFYEPFSKADISFEIAKGASMSLDEFGYRIVLHSTARGHDEIGIINKLKDDPLDGVVAMPMGNQRSAACFRDLCDEGFPMAFVDRYFPDIPIDRVVTDNFAGAREAVRDLISRGHRRIAYFSHFLNITSTYERDEGYKAALEEAGIEFDEDLLFGPAFARHGFWTFKHALYYCLHHPKPVTAIFGLNDIMVWSAVQAIDELGLLVGRDIELAGFFDTPIPRSIPLSIGRVVQDKTKMGEIAARMLVERIEGRYRGEARHVALLPEFLPADCTSDENSNQVLKQWMAATLANCHREHLRSILTQS